MNKEIPLGRISAVAFDRADPKKILIELASDKSLTARFVRMDLNFVAAALLRICRVHDIRIEQRDQVSVECWNNKICLSAAA